MYHCTTSTALQCMHILKKCLRTTPVHVSGLQSGLLFVPPLNCLPHISTDLVERTAENFRIAVRQFVEQLTVGRRALLEVERHAALVLALSALIGAIEPRPCSERD